MNAPEGTEAEVSRLRALKAQLEIAKLQKEIRDLGGDPAAPAAEPQGGKPTKQKGGIRVAGGLGKPC